MSLSPSVAAALRTVSASARRLHFSPLASAAAAIVPTLIRVRTSIAPAPLLRPFLSHRAMSSAAASSSSEGGPVQQRVHAKLQASFAPTFLSVLNESHMHAVPRGSETHFKVTVISSSFEGKPLLARHRAVNAALAEELQTPGGIHALSIVARTPEQWAKDQTVNQSPACMGGSKFEQQQRQA
jgi:BolA protein